MYDLLVVVLDENQHRRVGGAEFPVKSLETGPVFVRAVGQLPCVSDCTRRQLFWDLRKHFTTLNTLGLQNQLKSLFCSAAFSYALMFETQVCTLTSLTCWASRMTLWFRMWLKSSGSVETEAFGALSSTDTICTGTTCVWLTNSYYCLKVWLSKFF